MDTFREQFDEFLSKYQREKRSTNFLLLRDQEKKIIDFLIHKTNKGTGSAARQFRFYDKKLILMNFEDAWMKDVLLFSSSGKNVSAKSIPYGNLAN